MDSQEKATLQLHDALKECFEQIRFARAAELARSGCYLQAEGLLSPNGRESSDPKELDLLARIAAQQRQYGLARRRWETALQQSPDNAAYKRAIECAKEAEHFQTMLRKGAIVALMAFSVAVLTISVWNFFPLHSPTVRTKARPLPRELPPSHLTQGLQSPPENSNSTETTPKQIDPATPQTATKLPQVATPPSAPAPTEGTPTVPQPTPIATQPTPTPPEPATPQPAPPAIPPTGPSPAIPPAVPPPAIPQPDPATPQPTPTTQEPASVAPEPAPAAPQPPSPTILQPAPDTPQPEPSPVAPKNQ